MGVLQNKKALWNYEIVEKLEVGMKLEGWEVKSLRQGLVNFGGSWIRIKEGELFLENVKISPYLYSSQEQNPLRSKKLLLRKKEIQKIEQKIKEKGLTLIPIKIFTKGKFLKCEIALAKGRKKYEKKEVLRSRSTEKEARQILKNFNTRVR